MRHLAAIVLALADLNAGPGDSGAGIFNMRGEVIGVLSIGTMPVHFMGYYPWAFNDGEWPSG